jgi:hypothetical protein
MGDQLPVPQGRLNLAQDAVLGWCPPSKSPVGTTGRYQGMVRDHGTSPEIEIPRIASWVTFSTFSRPCGIPFRDVTHALKPNSLCILYGPTKVVP